MCRRRHTVKNTQRADSARFQMFLGVSFAIEPIDLFVARTGRAALSAFRKFGQTRNIDRIL
jgi:hypothetical protein